MPDGSSLAPGRAIITLPNVISFARLCAVPVAVWLVLDRDFAWAFALFVAAGLSDALDGWLARRQGGSALGAALDPAADKTLVVGMYVTLAAVGQIPPWLAILVVFRDLVIVGGIFLLWVTGHAVVFKPIALSKWNTAAQIGLIALVLGLDATGFSWPYLRLAGIWIVAATTLLSGAAYVRRAVDLSRG